MPMGEGATGGTGPDDVRPWTHLTHDAADALAAIVQSSDDAIYSKDDKALLTSWNPAAERLYGYTAEEALGKSVGILVPGYRKGEEIDILNKILAGQRVSHYETERVRKDGKLINVSVSVSPVHDVDGNIVEAAVVARDITKQVELQQALAESSHRQALELNDTIVQGLAAAKMALESGRLEQGLTTVTATLQNAQSIVSALLSETDAPIEPGDLVRDQPATIEGKGQSGKAS